MAGTPRIFVVDDDDDLVEILGALFESAGYEVVAAGSAEEAIRKIGGARPDIVVLDVMMEDMLAGLRVARYVRDFETNPQNRAFADVPILMMTSIHLQSDERFRAEAARWTLPIDSYLEKPAGLDTVLREVRRLLGREAGTPRSA